MKISFNWLKELIDINLSFEEFLDKLTFSGVEVEAVESRWHNLDKIVSAQVISVQKLGDNLKLCKVSNGTNAFQVVCAAPNCLPGLISSFAPLGSVVGGKKIKKAKIFGELSYGMLASELELEISDDGQGIMELPQTTPLGKSLNELGFAQDKIIEVEITPNRPDLLGMMGVAREISAILGKKFEDNLDFQLVESPKYKVSDFLKLTVQDSEDCPRFTLRVIKDVKVAPSPLWLKTKLASLGIKSINNIVDITNFVLMELGHPLHAFDLETVDGDEFVIRRAKNGEVFVGLDSKEYALDKNDIVVADSLRPMSIGGIIGGVDSSITKKTKSVCLEVACFNANSVHKTSCKHKIFTDASYRFERGMSPVMALTASARAAQLILEIAGGELARGVLDSAKKDFSKTKVTLRPSRAHRLLSVKIPEDDIVACLGNLHVDLIKKGEDSLEFAIPHYRSDLTREVDLIEELIRLYGYNRVPSHYKTQQITDKPLFNAKRNLSSFLVQEGFFEAANTSFFDTEALDKLLLPKQDVRNNVVRIANPAGASFSILRTTLVPTLLVNVEHNLNVGLRDIRLFEINKIYTAKEDGFADEPTYLTVVWCGEGKKPFWGSAKREVDFFDIKAIAQMFLNRLKIHNTCFKKSQNPIFDNLKSADFVVDGFVVGTFGMLRPKVVDNFGIAAQLFCIDLNLTTMLKRGKVNKRVFTEISRFPSVIRDISFLVDSSFCVEEIVSQIRKVNTTIIREVELFDEFRKVEFGKQKRSLSFSITFASPFKTLTDKKVNAVFSKIADSLVKEFNINLRR